MTLYFSVSFLPASTRFSKDKKAQNAFPLFVLGDFRIVLLVDLVTSPLEIISESDVTEL